jgi:lipopolysaccharide export system protein LptC
VRHPLAAIWDRFLLSLPLVLMSVLALASYWLVRTVQPVAAPVAPSVAQHAPDYFMESFTVKNFTKDGSLHAEVTGAAARHYPDAQWTEVDAIELRSQDAQGRKSTASATRGLSNEDASEVQLIGNAHVVREAQTPTPIQGRTSPRMEFRGEFLHLFTKEERVKSHLPVELHHGADRFKGDALDYDNVTQVLQLTGRVHATLVPSSSAP